MPFLCQLTSRNWNVKMIDLYTWNTPNGRKAAIMLEELGVPYLIKPINISTGEQKEASYTTINPNGRIPAIYDHDNQNRVFESGAILIYLAEKHKRFIPSEPKQKAEALGWLFWQASGLGPIVGQFNHFNSLNESNNYSLARFRDESLRLLTVLNKHLAQNKYIAGNEYTIADIINYTWVDTAFNGALNQNSEFQKMFEATNEWKNKLAQRPAVVTAIDKLSTLNTSKY